MSDESELPEPSLNEMVEINQETGQYDKSEKLYELTVLSNRPVKEGEILYTESELKQKQLELLEHAEKALQADWESTDKSHRMVERVFKYLKQRIGDV